MIRQKVRYAQRTMPALLEHNAKHLPDKMFLTDEHGSLTWAQIWERARRVGSSMADLGVQHGEPAAIVMDNRREFIEWLVLGTLGAIEVPVNPASTVSQLRHVLEHSGAHTVVVDSDYVDTVETLAAGIESITRLVIVGEQMGVQLPRTAFRDLDAEPRESADTAVAFSDIAAIMYTPGSTEPAKGVPLPHGQHYMNGWQAATAADITSDDVIYLCLPLHHNMAQGSA